MPYAVLLGDDKYEDITTEFAIRRTYCELAIKTLTHPSLLVLPDPIIQVRHHCQSRVWSTNSGDALPRIFVRCCQEKGKTCG